MILILYSLLGSLMAAIGIGGDEEADTETTTTSSQATTPDVDPDDAPGKDEDPFSAPASDAPDAPAAALAPGAAGDTVSIPEVGAGAYDIGWSGLSAEEQLIVELVNRARLDPEGELAYQAEGFAPGVSTAPKEALAVDAELSQAARDHSQDMDARNFFAHTNPDGQSPSARAAEAGYDGGGAGENIGWIGGFSVSDTQARATAHHNNLWDSDGHQQNFMSSGYNEIGVGYDYGDYTYNGTTYPASTLVTEKLGNDGDTYLTGVVIDDSDGDEFYDMGEGQGGVEITAYNADGVHTTATWSSGGYSLKLDPGTYTVVFHGGDLDGVYETQVTIGTQNVKLDVIEDRDAIDGTVTTSVTLSASAPANLGAELLEELAVDIVPEPEAEEDLVLA
ncbi:MAG: CAP domain-containing protein [Pseudomonadota bacterium]